MSTDFYISKIPICVTFKIYVFSFFIGLWVMFKRSLRWAWDPNSFNFVKKRDKPPSCLIDNSIGRHSYVKLKGTKLHYVEAGDKNNQLIILLHGFPDCWIGWKNQIPILAEHFHVVALDLKGFGDSDKPKSAKNYRIQIILDELNQFITVMGDKNCILIGHDLGALIGFYFAHLYPDGVYKFVAISSTHPNLFLENLTNDHLMNYFWLNFVHFWPNLPELEIMKDDLKIIENCFTHILEKDRNDIIEAYKFLFSHPDDWIGPLNYFRNFPFCKIEPQIQSNVPTLFITGNLDPTLKLEGIVKSTDFCEKFVMKIVENTKHFPHQENPELFNRILLNYLLHRPVPKSPEKNLTKNLMDRMFGAVSSTVKLGNSVLDSVQKRTNSYVNFSNNSKTLQSCQ